LHNLGGGAVKIRHTAVLVAVFVCALASSAQAAFPGANGKIAFVSTRTGNYDIYTMNADGSGVTALTNDAAIDASPAWSPDGREIAFISTRGSGGDLWVMNADGTGAKQLTAVTNVAFPTWSPDGNQIVFDHEGDLWTVNADGTNFNLLDGHFCDDVTLRCTYFHLATWSPDETTIDYVGAESDFSGGQEVSVQSDIWAIPAAGGTHVNVTNTPNLYENRPDWSPDGSRIAIDSSPPSTGSQIWTMHPDGTNRTQLTNALPLSEGPSWSPDQTKIAFVTYRDGNYEIYVMNADGSGQTNLTHNGATDWEPDWQPLRGPQRSDYKNAAQFCNAERDFLGDAAFAKKYGTNGNGTNAFGKCVSAN
jgi:Tol biopolymer transport system component